MPENIPAALSAALHQGSVDESAIEQTLRLVCNDSQHELRAIWGQKRGDRTVYFAYPENIDEAVSAIRKLLRQLPSVDVYVQLNPLDRIPVVPVNQGFVPMLPSKDRRIARRIWLLVDIDPSRPTGENSTEEELQAAAVVAQSLLDHLTAHGWPLPIIALSGNGVHLLYRIDLSNDDVSTELIRAALKTLAHRFNTSAATIDTTVFDPGRICRLYGTVNCKGPNTPDRPRRMSQILFSPRDAEIVTVGLLQRMIKDDAVHTAPAPRLKSFKKHRLTVDEFLDRLSSVRDSGTGWVAHCPAHHDSTPSLSVREGDDGRVLIYCHAGCEFSEILEVLDLSEWQLFPPQVGGRNSFVIRTAPIPEANLELHGFSEQCASTTTDAELEVLATQLGVTIASLRWLQVGWSPRDGAWTVPERRPDGWIIGIQLRSPDGSKRMITGSHRGLILPWEWWQYSGRVYLPEGASDVAALLTHGLPAIGRSSANGSIASLAELLRPTTLTPVVLGENDAKPDGRWPGRDGAERCANELASSLQRPVEIAFPPPAFKDVREYTQSIRTGAL